MPDRRSPLAVGVLVIAALLSTTAMAQVQSAPAAPMVAPSVLGEVIVTAQRRRENLERTPVAVQAVSGEALQRQAIVSEQDLQSTVPGLTVKASQGANQLNYSLRGQTVDAFSFSRPGVLPYFDEVQVGGAGSSAFYDLQSVQVLKGPQGTLFGRNSTGGAVVFTTTAPSDHFGGYINLQGGNYNDAQVDGAVNLPVIPDKVMLRLAGFSQSRDGFQYNLFDNARLGSVRRQDGRVSLLVKPTDRISNETVVDFSHSAGTNETGVIYNILPQGAAGAFVPNNILYTPGVDALFGPGTFAAFLAAHPKADPAGIVAYAATQHARGPFRVDVDAPEFHRANNVVISNITAVDLGGDQQLKNIFGYTRISQSDGGEFDGTPFPADSNGTQGRGGTLRQLSEELQNIGKLFDRKLSYVTGLYYSDEVDTESSSSVVADLLPLAPPVNQINYAVTTNRTYAAYGQGTLDLSQIVGVQGLGFTGGVRYSSERVELRHLPGDVYLSAPNPAFESSQADVFKKLSWQVGVQEQLNPSLLLYVVSRHSNRSGGFNFFAPPLPGFGNQGGSEYNPETATDVELGTKFQGNIFDVPVRLNVAAYNMWIEQIQRSVYVEIFGSLAGITVNVPEAQVRGIETDAAATPFSWLSVGGNANYTDAAFTRNQVQVPENPIVGFGPYPDTPRWSGLVYADITLQQSGSLRTILHSDIYAQSSTFFSSTGNTLNPGSKIPGYLIGNFRVSVEDRAAGWVVSGILKNAFDHTYYVGGIGFTNLLALNTVIPGDPRTFLFEVRKTF